MRILGELEIRFGVLGVVVGDCSLGLGLGLMVVGEFLEPRGKLWSTGGKT